MRQAGVLAAAGIVALETMVDRLAEDHAHARYFAECLADLPGVRLDPTLVKTNIVFFDLDPVSATASELSERIGREGVLIQVVNAKRMRAVTHYGIERADIEAALAAIRRAL